VDALPPTLNEDEQITGVSCVDCPGVLQVQTDGKKGFLRFKCRVGHVYSAHEVVAGKERRVEDRFWAALLSIEEFVALLRDLGRYEDRAEVRASYAERITRLEAQARTLRSMLDENEPVDLSPVGREPLREDEPSEAGP
jgi:two-component system chemotaxis response regulator CheB